MLNYLKKDEYQRCAHFSANRYKHDNNWIIDEFFSDLAE